MARWHARRSAVRANFLIRAKGLSADERRALRQEQALHGDVLMLPVAGDAMRGRMLTLLAWLRLAPQLFASARFICKGDDDVYIVTHELEAMLALAAAEHPGPQRDDGYAAHHGSAAVPPGRANGSRFVLHGMVVWHSWNVRHFVPHSFSYSYSPAVASLAIRYAAGQTHLARSPDERARLERCKTGGARFCEWCPTEGECAGPFPFVTGWLISMSAALATEIGHSAEVNAEAQRAMRLTRRWGPPILEDVWLGACIHRFLRHLPVRFVAMDAAHRFNGDWPERCMLAHARRCEARRRRDPAARCPPPTRNCGYEFNTTVVYHSKAMRELHQHVMHDPGAHATPQPSLKCDGALFPPRSLATGGRRVRYYDREEANMQIYVRNERRAATTALCAIIEV